MRMITPEHVEALLASDADTPALVVTAGSAAVVPRSALDSDQYRGAMEVISREDLVSRLGTDVPSRSELEEVSARLDSAVTRLGA
jgi:hypothetical protein